MVVHLEAARLEPVGLEAELAVELAGGIRGGHHGRMELLDAVPGMLDDLPTSRRPRPRPRAAART